MASNHSGPHVMSHVRSHVTSHLVPPGSSGDTTEDITLEDGFFILLESGDKLIAENN